MEKERRQSGLLRALLVLAIIGAINWGLIGFFNWNLVAAIFGGDTAMNASAFSRVIYALVGLSGLAALYFLPRLRVLRGGEYRATAPTVRREVHP